MKKNILNSLLLGVLVIGITSCKTKKLIVSPPPVTQKTDTVAMADKTTETLGMLRSKSFTYKTLSLKGRAKLDIDGEENNVSINIRIKDKEMIWISISAAIIGEVARVSITPDSIRILNRLQTTYTKKPFSFIYDFTSKKIDFAVLQSVLSGNLPDRFITADTKVIQENGVWVLTGSDEELAFRFLFNTLLRVQETNLNDISAQQALKVEYSNYLQVNGALFPSALMINSMSGTKKINIKLDFSNIEGNVPLDFPFSVKPRFKVIN